MQPIHVHNQRILEDTTREYQRAQKLKQQYLALKQQRDEIETQIRNLNWTYHQLTGGWFEVAGSDLRRLKLARFASMSSAERADLARQIRAYIYSKGGECMATEIGELFGAKIPALSVFMSRYVGTHKRGSRRSTVYILPPDVLNEQIAIKTT